MRIEGRSSTIPVRGTIWFYILLAAITQTKYQKGRSGVHHFLFTYGGTKPFELRLLHNAQLIIKNSGVLSGYSGYVINVTRDCGIR